NADPGQVEGRTGPCPHARDGGAADHEVVAISDYMLQLKPRPLDAVEAVAEPFTYPWRAVVGLVADRGHDVLHAKARREQRLRHFTGVECPARIAWRPPRSPANTAYS